MRRTFLIVSALVTTSVGILTAPSCVDSLATVGGGGFGGSGYDAGFPFVDGGEQCDTPLPNQAHVTMQPSTIFLTPCARMPCPTRRVMAVVEPDLCTETQVTVSSGDETIARTPTPANDEFCSTDEIGGGPVTPHFCLGIHRAALTLDISAGSQTGTTTVDVSIPVAGTTKTGSVKVVVLPAETAACSGSANTPKLKGGQTLTGENGLAGASITIPKDADLPPQGGIVWTVEPFAATLGCAQDIVPQGFVKLGPAITFGPASKSLQREIPLSIPINPALFPSAARLRHLKVAYSGPAFKQPRTIPVSDPHIEQVGGAWALTFAVPRLGTYQAVIAGDAGTHTFRRRLTHRAVMGISMGGGGTAMMGARHHDLFDVMAPLGGPSDWTWELNYIETNHLAGFRPIAKGTTLAQIQIDATSCTQSSDCKSDETCLGYTADPLVTGKCNLLPVATEPYEHPQSFNFWWYEYTKANPPSTGGNGGHFARTDYIEIFRDLAIMFGNPNGENLSSTGQNLPAGVSPDDKSVLGDHTHGECKMWVDPIDGDPNNAQEQAVAASCPTERCAHNLTLQNYFDDEYNPDGTFPVITVCDSSPQVVGSSPWANQWLPDNTAYPLEVGLAVDYNGNGVRDELEPIIRAGHEKYYDYGSDGVPSSQEPGYSPGVNDDPAGDDYNPQYNPTGTEGDHRYEPGEKFDDYGLDGVPGTKQQPPGGWAKPGDGYDVGEGDHKFTVSKGLQTFWDRDAHSIIRNMVDPSKIPAGELTDDALKRLDVWTDGGTRDLFNFGVDAQHFVGALAARGRDVQYVTNFTNVPGNDPKGAYDAPHVVFDDLPGVVFQRYGAQEATDATLGDGSGEHVGTPEEALYRLQSAFYFIGSRWREPELRTLSTSSEFEPDTSRPQCEILGNCTFDFKAKSGRSGPVGVTLPPGYANINNKGIRYPVIYFLHGYGQESTDLEAFATFIGNWMNSPTDSVATRLPKAIIVYVDGRCRVTNGKSECLRGTFFTDSVMAQGAQDESYWLELMDYIDQNYRTLGETEVDWTE